MSYSGYSKRHIGASEFVVDSHIFHGQLSVSKGISRARSYQIENRHIRAHFA